MSPANPLSDAAFHDPTNTSPRPTPQIPTRAGLFSIYSNAHIAAPPALVYATLLDVQNWHLWSTFIYDVTITSHPHPHIKHSDLKMVEGTNMVFNVQMSEGVKTTSKETCSHVEPLKLRRDHGDKAVTRVRWNLHNAAISTPRFLIKAERVNEIQEAEDGGTEYRTWQTFGGWGAGVVRRKYGGVLGERFGDWTRELKVYCEGVHLNGGGEAGVGAAPS
ncbi:hypothetical protein LTR08_006131 [Meristemomyces frigidus]|nr:hypothetical protein LTR08_006131 [Meristemomyces frigidus]